MSARRPVGLSRRDMEWIVSSMIRRVPTDPHELSKLIGDVVITLIEKNNAAIAKCLEPEHDEGTHD